MLSIAKNGVSISSDLIESLSERGVKTFFLDFRGVAHSALLGQSQYGVVSVRIAQMVFCQNNTLSLARKIISAKIKNQRAVLNYLDKYHNSNFLKSAIQELCPAVRACFISFSSITHFPATEILGRKTRQLWIIVFLSSLTFS